jgi:multidrug efflux pump subunit AcrB
VRLAELAVRRPQFTIIVFLLLAALGVYSFRTIPRSEDPQFPIPIFRVVAVYPGATPSDLEQLVVDPIENAVGELDDLENIRTRIFDGVAVIVVEFNADVDVEARHQALLRQVGEVRADLPALHRLEVEKFSTSDVSLAQVALVSPTASYRDLREEADVLERRLEALEGVRSATVWAAPEEEVRVDLDLGKLATLGVPVTQVIEALASDNTNLPGGSVDAAGRRLSVKVSGQYRSIEQLAETVVAGDGDGVVHLSDVAEVRWHDERQEVRARASGQRAVVVTATQKEGQNVFAVAERIRGALDEVERGLPPGMRLERGFDQSKNVARRLDGLYVDFAIAILLVLVTLLPLGLRASLLVMISIPLSLAVGLSLLHASGFGINQLSIVGFVIALGLLVDDSIVVVENITRFLREGHPRRDAAILATRQIAAAVLGCTATLIFAFVPLVMLPGSSGDFIRSLPVALLFTIAASLLVSLTIVPFLASALMSRHHDEEGNVVLRALRRVIEASYRPLLDRALRRPRATLVASGVLVAASVALVPAIGFSLFPKAGLPQFIVAVETPDGSSLDETDRAVRFVEGVLGGVPEVDWTMATVGRGNPQIYYNRQPAPERANVAEVLVQLGGFDPVETPELLDRLRARLSSYPGAVIRVLEFEQGPSIDAPIAMRLVGDDVEVLGQLAAKVAAVMEETPGTLYVDNPVAIRRTDLLVRVDRDKAGLHGVPTARVAQMVRLGVSGLDAGTLRDPDGDEHRIALGLRQGGYGDLAAFDNLYVPSVTGRALPLRQVAEVELTASPTSIQHHDQERSVTVTSHVVTGYNTDRVTRQVLARLADLELPPGYRLEAAGEMERRKKSFGGLGAAVLIAVFLIMAVLVLEFGTFRGTIVVASVIPLGVVGGLVLLWLTGNTLSFTSMVGFIALIGIEIKNSILLVDFTDQLRRAGMPLEEAIRQAGEVRFLPIVLTTMTAIGGLLPLALASSPLYSPLALVIIGGLISSTVLARLVTPVMYKLLAPGEVRGRGAAR